MEHLENVVIEIPKKELASYRKDFSKRGMVSAMNQEHDISRTTIYRVLETGRATGRVYGEMIKFICNSKL